MSTLKKNLHWLREENLEILHRLRLHASSAPSHFAGLHSLHKMILGESPERRMLLLVATATEGRRVIHLYLDSEVATFPGLCPNFISQPIFLHGCEIKSGRRPGNKANSELCQTVKAFTRYYACPS